MAVVSSVSVIKWMSSSSLRIVGFGLAISCNNALSSVSEQIHDDNLYPDGFNAGQFAAIIEAGTIWDVVTIPVQG